MANTSTDVIRRYLAEAIRVEKEAESRLRTLAEQGDDAEVQAFFRLDADETSARHRRLSDRLAALGESPSPVKDFFQELFASAPKMQPDDSDGQSVVNNLILAFSIEKSKCAMYEALANVAVAASDPETEALARAIQAQANAAADKLWRFLPSRSKIAFNLSTAGEIDPAIETKAPDDRIIG
ncbi:MAG: DUF892 family protein [Acidobacteriaceae bacterium]|nr:DUF892 family protein [Acidobacteriaceae bacterium]